MVVARRGHRRKHLEGIARGVKQFWRQHRAGIAERVGNVLPTDDDHLPVRQHHAVVHAAGIGHGRNGADLQRAVDVDQQTVGGGWFSAAAIAIGGGAAGFEYLPRVVHHGVAVHAVGIVAACAGKAHIAVAAGVYPMHMGTGPRLEDFAIARRQQPHVVIRAVNALRVGHVAAGIGVYHAAVDQPGRHAPDTAAGRPDLAVLAAESAAP